MSFWTGAIRQGYRPHLRKPTSGLITTFSLPLESLTEEGIARKPTQPTAGGNGLFMLQPHKLSLNCISYLREAVQPHNTSLVIKASLVSD